MAVHNITTALMNLVQNIKNSFVSSKFQRYVRYAGIVIVAALFVWLCLFGYRWYVARRNMAAQYTFSQAMDEYTKAQGATATQSWVDVEAAFRLGYEQHNSSVLAPYFLGFQAQTLLHQGKKKEALEVFDRALSLMTSASPLFATYSIKKSLMMLDSDDQSVQEAGLKALTASAHDVKNHQRDEALYYLGLYYASKVDAEQARAQWGLLVQQFPAQGQSGSIYAELVQTRLDQMG